MSDVFGQTKKMAYLLYDQARKRRSVTFRRRSHEYMHIVIVWLVGPYFFCTYSLTPVPVTLARAQRWTAKG